MLIEIDFWLPYFVRVSKKTFETEMKKVNWTRDSRCNGDYYRAADYNDKPLIGIHVDGKWYLRRACADFPLAIAHRGN